MSMKTIFYLDKQSHISSCFDNIEMFSMRFHSALFEMKKRSGCGNFEKHGAYANQLANTSSLENLKGKNFTETDGVYEVPNNGKITLLSLILLPMPLVWKPIQKVEDFSLDYGATIDDILAKLPETVTVKLTDGNGKTVSPGIQKNVKLDALGTYDVIGTVEGTDITTTVKVTIKDDSPVIHIEPENVKITVEAGTDKADVISMLPTEVTGTKESGRAISVSVLEWDLTQVDLTSVGTYTAVATLQDTTNGHGGEQNITSMEAIIEVTAPTTSSDKPDTDKPSIPGGADSDSDWEWPTSSGSDHNTEKENPSSGDHGVLPVAIAVLGAAAGAILFGTEKRRK